METNKSKWNTESFLVCDKSLRIIDAPFFDWLRSEGFHWGWNHYVHGHTYCCWVYVNITTKRFIYGLNGYRLMEPTGHHAITIDEFKTIYDIYKKYESKDVFVFNNERFDYDETKASVRLLKEFEEKKKLYFISMPLDRDIIDDAWILPDSFGLQTKYYADKEIQVYSGEYRDKHRFCVISTYNFVKEGDMFDKEKMEVCFQLI